jgi:hypothetical protein
MSRAFERSSATLVFENSVIRSGQWKSKRARPGLVPPSKDFILHEGTPSRRYIDVDSLKAYIFVFCYLHLDIFI